MSTLAPAAPALAVEDIVSELQRCGCQMRPATDRTMVRRVLARIVNGGGEREACSLALTAILLDPRPEWLRDLIGGDLMRERRAAHR